MPDQFGFSEGVKTLTGSLDASRESAKSLTKSVEDIQKDSASVAQDKARERRRIDRENELKKELFLRKVLTEWQRQEDIRREEARLKADFIRRNGNKWAEIEALKAKLEKSEQAYKKAFDADLSAVRRAQIYCFLAAAVVAYFIVWGDK